MKTLEEIVTEVKELFPKVQGIEVGMDIFDEYIERVYTCSEPLYVNDVLITIGKDNDYIKIMTGKKETSSERV